jgi:drug/metabolite transporter (DMT)-like permease
MFFLGEGAALAGSALWGISSYFYGNIVRSIRPSKMNLVKNIYAACCFGLVCLCFRIPTSGLGMHETVALFLSGMIGIGLGDTVWFLSLKYLPVHSVLVVGTLSPIVTALFAWALIGEALSFFAWISMLLTMCGIVVVVSERQEKSASLAKSDYRTRILGIGLVVLAVLLGAVSNVITRSVFATAEISPFWSGFLRLIAGMLVALFAVVFFRGAAKSDPKVAKVVYLKLLFAASLGTVVGIFCQQTAFKYASAGVAQALMSTTPIFAIGFLFFTGRRPSSRALIGSAIATLGVVGLVLSKDF